MQDEVHIWAVDLDHLNVPVCGAEAEQMLPESERATSERLRFEILRMRYVESHYLLRVLLGHYLGADFYHQEFNRNEQGKPSLKNQQGRNSIYFNISNSENMCVFAFSTDGAIGVDIEKIHELSDMGSIVESFFSQLDNETFCSLPEHSRKKTFFKYWTRKEALLKAMGVGLSFPLDTFNILSDEDNAAQVSIITKHRNAKTEWTLRDIDIFKGFASAFALEGQHTDCRARLRYFKLEDKIIISPEKETDYMYQIASTAIPSCSSGCSACEQRRSI